MDAVNFVSCSIGRCMDTCCLLVDLVIWVVSWLTRLLSNMGGSLHNLPTALSSSTLVEYWNLALFSFLTVTEVVSSAAQGALHTLDSCLQTLGGVFESFKMVGHLSSHLAWRAKELLHRWLLSGSLILRQTWEGICIALSLVLYFLNTVVNILLIGLQNCLCVFAGAWEALAGPLHQALELTLTLLTFLYSCLVGASVLLWTPCQLLLDSMGAFGHVLITVCMQDGYALLMIAAVALLALLYLNPGHPLHILQQRLGFVDALQGVCTCLQTAICRLYTVFLEPGQTRGEVRALELQEVNGTRPAYTNLRAMDAELNQSNPLQIDSHPEGEPHNSSSEPTNHSPSVVRTSKSRHRSKSAEGAGDDSNLLSLLKEQEERKKCVICQDLAKSVLLLPCRHLCLCRHCSSILTQQTPQQQRCCPLCRQPITQTMDVFL
ncbi:E3 ubiquitin-protein ligase RNF26-like [Lampris incognitus]|uniref:E3 ubiquitin-protein ligase RNF26-like n=1 Tax=Lampris incognitus TaxID=2546036 RepID=UPI0024B520E9|nr:E3 ubiquitin-protein ligase RNF26-like [Lampris incognitus]